MYKLVLKNVDNILVVLYLKIHTHLKILFKTNKYNKYFKVYKKTDNLSHQLNCLKL
jgi:hypothetical protein